MRPLSTLVALFMMMGALGCGRDVTSSQAATPPAAGGTTVPATAVSATTATLDASGVTGTFRVIAIFDSGSYCNNTPVTLP